MPLAGGFAQPVRGHRCASFVSLMWLALCCEERGRVGFGKSNLGRVRFRSALGGGDISDMTVLRDDLGQSATAWLLVLYEAKGAPEL